MTYQRDILLAAKALVEAALPLADVRGFDGDTSKPDKIGSDGTVIGHPGEPGDPEVDLSPLAFNYAHRMYLEVGAAGGAGGAPLDAMLAAIGVAIRAERTLGGLCDWLEAVAPDRNDRTTARVATTNWAVLPIVAHYTTSDPLA